MRCPHCGTDNFTVTRYCVECGIDMDQSPRAAPGADASMAPPGNLLWIFRTGGIISAAPVIAEGVAYFGSRDRHLYALDLASRRLKWSFAAGDQIEAPPAIAGGTVYCGCNNRRLYAIDAATGSSKWSFAADRPITAAPAIAGRLVLAGSHDGTMHAVDALTGTERWRLRNPGGAVRRDFTRGELVLMLTLGGLQIFVLTSVLIKIS